MNHSKIEPIPDETNKLTGEIVNAAYVVHTTYGPGLLESVYEKCLTHELKLRGIKIESQVNVPLNYKGLMIERGLIVDLMVEDRVIVEVKSVEESHPIHQQQLLTYLKITGKRVGLLINFNSPLIKDGIKRMVL